MLSTVLNRILLFKVNSNSFSGYVRGALLRKLGSFYTRVILLCVGYIYIKESRYNGIVISKYPKIKLSEQRATIVITNKPGNGNIM